MRGFGRAGWVALVAAALVPTGPASAAKVRTVKNESIIATGSLTYTWSGDPARGCAAVGVCGIHGELILRPQTSGQNVAPGLGPVSVFLDPSSAARVVRKEGGAVVGECVDLPASSFDMLFFTLPRRGAKTSATIQSPPSSGRCAGPTGADLARVSVRVRRTGRLSFDLTGTRSFTAGPFSGTLVSTVRLAPAPASFGAEGSSSVGSSGPGGPTAARPLLEFVQLRYRVSPAPSGIETRFSGASPPGCQILDACATSGSLAFSIQPTRTLTVIGERQVHSRLSREQVLNDVRQGRLSLSTYVVMAGRVSETFNWSDGSSCRDTVTTPSLILSDGFAGAPTAGRTIPVTLIANGGPGSNVFRTRCPGPDDADLFGANTNGGPQTYARGSVTTAQLLAKQSVVMLSEPGAFNGLGYVGSRSGAVALNLTLTKVTARTQR